MSKLDPLRQAVAVSPDNIPLLLLLAHASLDEWSLDEARTIFDRILRLDPQRPEARLGIARVLHLSGKTSEAVVRTEALISDHPRFAPAHLLLARLHAGEGNRAAARECYEQALALDPAGKGRLAGKGTRGPLVATKSRKRRARKSHGHRLVASE